MNGKVNSPTPSQRCIRGTWTLGRCRLKTLKINCVEEEHHLPSSSFFKGFKMSIFRVLCSMSRFFYPLKSMAESFVDFSPPVDETLRPNRLRQGLGFGVMDVLSILSRYIRPDEISE